MNEILFEELYIKYYNRIFAYCYSKTGSQDLSASITNDAFLLLREKWDTVDFDDCPEKVSVWLLRVAAYKLQEQFRRSDTQITIENIDHYIHALLDDASLSTGSSLTYEEYLLEIKRRLDTADAEVFELLAVRDLKQQEAADLLGITVGALKMKWKRIKPKIVDIIRDIQKNFL